MQEVKKSDKMEHAHIAQTKYYLYLLEIELGIESGHSLDNRITFIRFIFISISFFHLL